MKFLLAVLIVLAMVIAKTPAVWVDRLVSQVSRGELRLARTEGSIWSGRGAVNVIDVATHQWRPWFRLEWSLQPARLLQGRLAWLLTSDGVASSSLDIGISTLRVSELKLNGPAHYFWQRVPGPLAKFAWDGDVSLSIDLLECSWRGLCDGRLQAGWVGAASDFLPGQVFGDYLVQASGVAGDFRFNWTSSGESYVQTMGSGSVSHVGKVQLAGTIKGNAELLRRIPAVASAWVRPTAAEDTWEVHFP